MGSAGARLRVVIAGANGFIGRALAQRLAADFDVIGLSRRPPADGGPSGVTWRACDLYSVLETERALAGADVAVYLVHSMLPSARLTQASFEDLDLLLADNFARAARAAGVKQLVYLGGLVPDGERSRHLESRREVEDALAALGVPLTALRAGLVVGPGSSSLAILTALVQRLPLMLTPRWTETRSQPIALDDLVAALAHVVGRPECYGQTYDVGGPDVLTYREMMERTARAFGLRRRFFRLPVLTPRLSVAWVCLVTGAPRQLVGPLVESLRHPMVARDNRLLDALGGPRVGFDDAVARAIAGQPPATDSGTRGPAAPGRTARSVQRLPLPPGRDARWVAETYGRWLPRPFRPFLAVRAEGHVLRFQVRGLGWTLLELTWQPERSSSDRALYFVTGGLLAKLRDELPPTRRGRLEFRSVKHGAAVLAAMHDFEPRLPWPVYATTQAVVHRWVIQSFGRFLAQQADRGPTKPLAGAAADFSR